MAVTKWMQGAVNREGALRKHFKVADGKTIPAEKITGELARLHAKALKGSLSPEELQLERELNLAKTFRSFAQKRKRG